MLRNALACLLFHVRCRHIDYALKRTLRVRCLSFQSSSSRPFATCTLQLADEQRPSQFTVYLFNQAAALRLLRARCQSSTLLELSEEAFERALESLRYYTQTAEPFCVEIVSDEQGRATLSAVQQHFPSGTQRNTDGERSLAQTQQQREQWRTRWSMPAASDERSALLAPSEQQRVVPIYFTYTVQYGEIYWIPTLHSAEKGNYWPPSHRMKSVVRFKTLRQLFALTTADAP